MKGFLFMMMISSLILNQPKLLLIIIGTGETDRETYTSNTIFHQEGVGRVLAGHVRDQRTEDKQSEFKCLKTDDFHGIQIHTTEITENILLFSLKRKLFVVLKITVFK